MVNEQKEIALSNTEPEALMTFRQDFVSIYFEQYKIARQMGTVAPVDIVVDIDSTDQSDNDLAHTFQNELFYAWQEIQNQMASNAYLDAIADAYQDSDIVQQVTLINNAKLIEILMIHHDIIKKTYRGKDRRAFAAFFTNVIRNLINNEKSAFDILSTQEEKYAHLVAHVKEKYPSYEIYKHGPVGFSEDELYPIGKEELIRAIDDLYLSRRNRINEVNDFWKKLKRDIRREKVSVYDVLENTNYQELRAYVYNNSLKKYTSHYRINIEQYRPEILTKIEKALVHSRYRLREINATKELTPELRKERSNAKRLIKEYKKILSLLQSKQKHSLVDILDKHLIIFFFFTIEGATEEELTDEKLYPRLSQVYKRYMEADWIYGKKQETVHIEQLDEVVITALKLHKPTFGSPYYRISTGSIYTFLKDNVGEAISFKEHFKYNSKHKIEFARDLGEYTDHLSELHFRGLFGKEDRIKESSFDLTCIEAEIKIKEVAEAVGRGVQKRIRPCFYVYIKDILGEQLFVLETMRPQTFERIVKDLNVTVSTQSTNELNDFFRRNIRKYRANRSSYYSKEMLAFFYKYLPESTYKNEAGGHVIYDDRDGNIGNDRIGDRDTGFTYEELKEDLEHLLDSWHVGDGKEKAIVSILMAMPPEQAYNYLYKDTKTLKLLVDGIDGDNFHKLFVQYVAYLIDQFGNKQSRTIWFGNDTWFPEIQLTGSWDGGDSFTISNYMRDSFTPWIEYGERTDINLEEVPYHPMDLVAMSTVIDGEVMPPIYVPAFYVAKKIEIKRNWDYFNVGLDVISVLSLQGSARFILKTALRKAGDRIARRQAIQLALHSANVLKETSSFAIRNESLRKAMDPDLYKAWRFLDTTGDLIYLGGAIRSLKNLKIFKAKPRDLNELDGLGGGRISFGNTAGDLAEANNRFIRLKEFLEASKRAIRQFKEAGEEIPAKLKTKLLALEKELNDFLDQVDILPRNEQRVILAGVSDSRLNVNLFDDVTSGSRQLNINTPRGNLGNSSRRLTKNEEAISQIDDLVANGKLDVAKAAEAKKYFELVSNPKIPFEEVIRKVKNGFTLDIKTKRFSKPSNFEKAKTVVTKKPIDELSKTSQRRAQVAGSKRKQQKEVKNEAEEVFLKKHGISKTEYKALTKAERNALKQTPEGITLSRAIGKLLGLSEDLGDIAVKAWIKAKFGDGFKLKKANTGPGKQNEFDYIVELPNKDYIIIDAKGAGSGKGTRITLSGKVAQQGTPAYTQDIIDYMLNTKKKELVKIAKELKNAWKNGKLNYLFINQGVKKSDDINDYLKIEKAIID